MDSGLSHGKVVLFTWYALVFLFYSVYRNHPNYNITFLILMLNFSGLLDIFIYNELWIQNILLFLSTFIN